MSTRYALPAALKQVAKNTKDCNLYYVSNGHHKTIFLNVYKQFVRLTKLINYNKTNMKNDYRVRLNYRYYLSHKFRYENYPLKKSVVLDTHIASKTSCTHYSDDIHNGKNVATDTRSTYGESQILSDQEKKIDANVLINTYYFILKGIRYNMVHCNVNNCGDAVITDLTRSTNDGTTSTTTNNNITTISNDCNSNLNAYEYKGKEDDLICKQIMKNLLNMQYEKFKLHNSPRNGSSGKATANEINSPTFYNKDSKLLQNQMKYWNILYRDYSYLQIKCNYTTNLLNKEHKTKDNKNSKKDNKADQFALKMLNISKFERDLVYLNEMLHTQL
mgnify:CR=1 FL=1